MRLVLVDYFAWFEGVTSTLWPPGRLTSLSKVLFYFKDMFLCELLQAAHGRLLKLHQTLTGTRVLHLDLPLTLLCRETHTEVALLHKLCI